MNYISTTALARKLNIKPTLLFEKLKLLGWIEKTDGKWSLTSLGEQNNGQTRINQKFGAFIVWPDDINIIQQQTTSPKLISAIEIGKEFNVSEKRMNLILSEFGWIENSPSGWKTTRLGEIYGGKTLYHENPLENSIVWPEEILQNKSLVNIFNEMPVERANPALAGKTTIKHPLPKQNKPNNFRNKFEATHRTKDGHFVRSKAEVIIDNTLYDYGIVHAYEKKLPIEEELYTDFYLPSGKVYIEFWGMLNDPKYLERKKIKLSIYKKYELNLIELDENDIANLDDHLPIKLLKFGIKVY